VPFRRRSSTVVALALGLGCSAGNTPTPLPPSKDTRTFRATDVPRTTPNGGIATSAIDVQAFPGQLTDIRLNVIVFGVNGALICEAGLTVAHPDSTAITLVYADALQWPCSGGITTAFPTPSPPFRPLTPLLGKSAEGTWRLSLAARGESLGGSPRAAVREASTKIRQAGHSVTQ